ncbi:MAG: hypothetical protein COB67_13090, partial [SAR324 cluster bacterium]
MKEAKAPSLIESIQIILNRFVLDQKTLQEIRQLQAFFKKLETKCESEADRKIFARLQRIQDLKFFQLVVPEQVELTLHEIVRMAQLGIKVGCVDPIKIEANKKGSYSVFHVLDVESNQKIEILPANWGDQYKCALHPKSYQKLFAYRKQILSRLRQVYGKASPQQILKSHQSVRQHIFKQVHQAIWEFKIPTIEDLNHPQVMQLQESLFRTGEGKSLVSTLAKDSKTILSLQGMGSVPSLFQAKSHEKIAAKKYHFIFLINAGASTEEGELYKKIQHACVQVRQMIKKIMPQASVAYLLYDNEPQDILESIEEFLSPTGESRPEAAFAQALRGFDQDDVFNSLIHITNDQIELSDRVAKGMKPFHQRRI